MNKRIAVLAGVLVVSLVMLACSLPMPGTQLQPKDIQSISDSVVQTLSAQNQQYLPRPLSNAEVVATSVAQTVVALNAQSQAVQAQAAAAVPASIPYVYYPAPTATVIPCNLATARDINYLDNTSVNANTLFYKTWRFTNVGSCTWNTGYYLAFVSGTSMGGTTTHLTSSVAPGGSIDVTVALTAPAAAGNYRGNWVLCSNPGYCFGSVWVTINSVSVAPPLPTFAVTGVSISANLTICTFSAAITANGAGTATYQWKYSSDAGVTYTSGTLTALPFVGADTKTVTATLAGATTYLVHVYIDTPNHQEFGSAASFICP
jgi:hypothetical protein